MPWTLNDYPSSLKNLPKEAKKKAIDIANSLVDEEYPESKAIPIATEQAKKWYENASSKERENFLHHGKPTKHDAEYSSRPELLDKDELVVPHEDKWAVQSKDAKKPDKLFHTKKEAMEHGRNIAKNKGTHLIIYRKDGTKETTYNYHDEEKD